MSHIPKKKVYDPDKAAATRDHFWNVKERFWLQDKVIVLNSALRQKTGDSESIRWIVSGVSMKNHQARLVSQLSKKIELVDLTWLMGAIDAGYFSLLGARPTRSEQEAGNVPARSDLRGEAIEVGQSLSGRVFRT